MSRRANAINRVALTVLGLLFIAAGGIGLAISTGTSGAWPANDPLLREEVRTYPDGRPWFWWAVAVALVLIVVLALLWLLAQFKTHGTTRWDLTTDARDGYTTLHTSALTHALEDEAHGISGVTSASASVHERRGQHVFLRVGLAESADLNGVRARLENEVVEHVREGVGDPGVPMTIELRPGVKTSQRTLA